MITREIDYALRILRALSSGEKKNIGEICEKEHIPKAFAYKILQKLSKCSYISIERGVKGGYLLAVSLKEITILDVIKAIQTDFFINNCTGDDYICDNNASGDNCKIHEELLRIQTVIFNELSKKSIEQILS